MNILVTGGTGFVGSRLCEVLAQRGHRLIVLSRNARRAAEILPEGARVIGSLDEVDSDEEVDGIVNLAGEGIASGRWTSSRKKILFD
ncbi:MAG: NAD-dependent epimerase/dehydratase family protein, partial [Alcanivoracaceae bacterium]